MDDTSRVLLSPLAFFTLVDAVLEKNDRAPLDPKGPQRGIIEVRPTDRVLQILAGPGSGKTEMLVWRVLFELLVRGVDSSRILVTTFTNKAATELGVRLVERCDQLLKLAHETGQAVSDPRVHDVRIGTIHSLCDSLLAEFDTSYMEAGTQVIDDIETRVRITKDRAIAFRDVPSNPNAVDGRLLQYPELYNLFRPPWVGPDQTWPATQMERVDFFMGLLAQQTETWFPRCQPTGIPHGTEVIHHLHNLTSDLEKLRSRWEQYLNKNSILDFPTIQKRFLERQSSVLPHIDHIFVDEFQDTNPIQFAIHSTWLTRTATRLTVVGDDDQALYRFRGSDIECFNQLSPYCKHHGIPYRIEKLEENWRSTQRIIDFARSFRESSALKSTSMGKTIIAPKKAKLGTHVRLLIGPWQELSGCVAAELQKLGAGQQPAEKNTTPPSAAVLMFSTSERSTKKADSAALVLRETLKDAQLRVYNPRNKTAADNDSPVAELLGFLSYLIDPVTMAPAGKRGLVQVWATAKEAAYVAHAVSAPPSFPISAAYAGFQKKLMKAEGGKVGAPAGNRAEVVHYIDQIRSQLLNASASGKPPKLTLAGLVARLLTFSRYRDSGYNVDLFRQAMFTKLLEATIAPTRLTMKSLDAPLTPTHNTAGKIVWPDQFWTFLNVLGALLEHTTLDDIEVESFAEDAVALMTFHQTKGLEFDHVYVASTGREPTPHAVLQTMLFSGKTPNYQIVDQQPSTTDPHVLGLATADRDREIYVALTRAKRTLTILWDPDDERPNMALHAVIEEAFSKVPGKPHTAKPAVTVKEWPNA